MLFRSGWVRVWDPRVRTFSNLLKNKDLRRRESQLSFCVLLFRLDGGSVAEGRRVRATRHIAQQARPDLLGGGRARDRDAPLFLAA